MKEPVMKTLEEEFETKINVSKEKEVEDWSDWQIDWNLKSNKIYWRGGPNDGGSSPDAHQPNFR